MPTKPFSQLTQREPLTAPRPDSPYSDNNFTPGLAKLTPEEALVKLVYTQKRIYDRQQTFLAAFALGGTIQKGIDASEIPRQTIQAWREFDVLDFKERFTQAHHVYCDRLEGKLGELAFGLKPGQNALPLVVALNAEMPDKYRPNSVQTDDTAKEVMAHIKRRMTRTVTIEETVEET